ncbi:MOSC domain-containing protein [Xanthobacteraceae bacterium Astr-EGSB]|uniref:MOSC domain-containing protein n=1 Tax=Astrobacterium formosum TaxID=3069710 RepID=UPI0027AE1E55|nr:MOSC domain-containing protein [Xanthobacteraceae bacterium Astr-EGSB]
MIAPARIKSLFRYPVKGLSPDPLGNTRLEPGRTIAADRLYAIENGPSGFDPAAPAHFPKQRFLMLMRNERLAALATRFDEATHVLTVCRGNRIAATGDLRTPAGRAVIETFFAGYCADELAGPPKVLQADGHSFSDVAAKVVSIINLASVAAIAGVVGVPVDPLRFRANLYVEGWPEWSEFDLVGREILIGAARAKVMKRIVRCAATNVQPGTGTRDLAIPKTLMQHFGHADCGVYAQIIAGGDVAVGDAVVAA